MLRDQADVELSGDRWRRCYETKRKYIVVRGRGMRHHGDYFVELSGYVDGTSRDHAVVL